MLTHHPVYQSVESTFSALAQTVGLPSRIAVAYSGGLDSSVLLDAVAQYAARNGITLCALHIHHGISPYADQWQTHCANTCAQLNIELFTQKITLHNAQKQGLEEAARISRYAALGALCRQHQIACLLTAHHLDDQAETVLLQLLRGAGTAGLSSMDRWNSAASLLGDATVLMVRPLLNVSRAVMEAYAIAQQLTYVEDESNQDLRYARNVLRQQVMPVLGNYFPGFQERFSRSAQHMQSAQKLLIDLAEHDLARYSDDTGLNLTHLRQLDDARIDNLLRYWLGKHNLRMPSFAWLSEMRQQLLEAKPDAQLCVTHPQCHIQRYRDHIFLTPRNADIAVKNDVEIFQWDGQNALYFSKFGGTLHFDQQEYGLAAAWLRQTPLCMTYRTGGERMKLAPNRSTKSLKYHYQASAVPPWERARLPLIKHDKQVLFAAGIGMDCHHISSEPGIHICLRWQADEISLKK